MREVSVAAAIIQDALGRLLIAQRAEPEHLRGLWEFPGGKIEDGESPETALLREIDEELAMTVSIEKYLGEFPYTFDHGVIRIFAYTARATDTRFQVLDHLDVRWIEPSELDAYQMAPADLPIIQAFLALKN